MHPEMNKSSKILINFEWIAGVSLLIINTVLLVQINHIHANGIGCLALSRQKHVPWADQPSSIAIITEEICIRTYGLFPCTLYKISFNNRIFCSFWSINQMYFLKITYDSTNTNLNLQFILETITNASTIPPPPQTPYPPHLPQQCLKIV